MSASRTRTLLLASALCFAACGGDDPDESEDTLTAVDATSDAANEDTSQPGPDADDVQADDDATADAGEDVVDSDVSDPDAVSDAVDSDAGEDAPETDVANPDATEDTVDPDSGEDADVAEPTCDDGEENGNETDIDCGGDTCSACVDGAGCDVGEDCESAVCSGGVCLAPGCVDGVQNGDETDVDCGADCSPCEAGELCLESTDCASLVCLVAGVCAQPACGDGVRNGSERCDDGNRDNTDACRNDCTAPICGDAILDAGEACDDGNASDIDGCRNNCTIPACGDGIVDDGESCDDGNAVNEDGCRNTCELPRCGDGVADPGEACDDGNSSNFDECRNNCTVPVCGDGVVDGTEFCDDGNAVNSDGCRNNCTVPACGDGIVDDGESCDDGNAVNTDGCRNDCTVPVCGDGRRDEGEVCDDGNAVNTDACRNNCVRPACGDGIVDPTEVCDDGNAVNTDACRNNCTVPECGDGVVDAGESCDDGNDNNADACRVDCTVPLCGDGILDAGEECDDGNAVNIDACTNACTTPVCGDGSVDFGEACDDGNAVNTDGCSNNCQLPGCGDAVLQDGEACDDGNDDDTDACSNACELPRCGDGIVQPAHPITDERSTDFDFEDGVVPSAFLGTGNAEWAASTESFGGTYALRSGDVEDSESSGFEFTVSSAFVLTLRFDYRVDAEATYDELVVSVNDSAVADLGSAVWTAFEYDLPVGENTVRIAFVKDTSVSSGEDAAWVDNLSLSVTETLTEQCDDAASNSNSSADACRTTCRAAYCGDGVWDTGEVCDDGNLIDSDTCPNNCGVSVCGDGVVDGTEQCDDGNGIDDDGCDNACTLLTCSDRRRNGAETGIDCGGTCGPCNGTFTVREGEACTLPGRTSLATPRVCGDGFVCVDYDGVDEFGQCLPSCSEAGASCGEGAGVCNALSVTSPLACEQACTSAADCGPGGYDCAGGVCQLRPPVVASTFAQFCDPISDGYFDEQHMCPANLECLAYINALFRLGICLDLCTPGDDSTCAEPGTACNPFGYCLEPCTSDDECDARGTGCGDFDGEDFCELSRAPGVRTPGEVCDFGREADRCEPGLYCIGRREQARVCGEPCETVSDCTPLADATTECVTLSDGEGACMATCSVDADCPGEFVCDINTCYAECDATCRANRCGDGRVDDWERCDDGNTFGGDACAADCSRGAATLLRNDGLGGGGLETVGEQTGVEAGDILAGCFDAPSATGDWLDEIALWSALDSGEEAEWRITAWWTTSATSPPSGLLGSFDTFVTGQAGDELEVISVPRDGDPAGGLAVDGRFCVGVQWLTQTPTFLARDDDGIAAPNDNWVYDAARGEWLRSTDLGVAGDWIIRAVVSAR